ncbi:hypothetical protein PR202_ga23902 [Eleusine coracana subsp. coracana]|uniref:FAD synthase n=1 Tax=Eleusine coracana subsp. coracana TaxID=191504 RepID=A0AAV5D700_ELECO|nr:hypothetical protein PR202_ga23902 [Eleusine coracana subsp. coracana]
MEINEAVRGSSDRRMRTKYGNAVYVVQRAFALYPFEEVAFSFNGGKDSTVLLHLIRAGYYLYKKDSGDGAQIDALKNCPVRTIYFESPCAFPEINSFTYETVSDYGLPLETIQSDFKSGLEGLLKEKPTKAIFIGTRIGDPNAVGQEQFSPSSPGWPPFMRVNPILDWSYRFGTAEDKLGAALCNKLHAIGWRVSHIAVVRNEIDSVAEEIERCKSTDDMAPDEEFEDYLSQIMGNDYTGDRNEMALLPEGITELLHHKSLPLPLIKCRNVITLAATNVDELEIEWDCLLDTQESGLVRSKPFVSKHLHTVLSDVKIAPVLAKLCLEFSDVYIGSHRVSRSGPLVVNLTGKDNQRVEAAVEKLMSSFEGQFSQVDSCK